MGGVSLRVCLCISCDLRPLFTSAAFLVSVSQPRCSAGETQRDTEEVNSLHASISSNNTCECTCACYGGSSGIYLDHKSDEAGGVRVSLYSTLLNLNILFRADPGRLCPVDSLSLRYPVELGTPTGEKNKNKI